MVDWGFEEDVHLKRFTTQINLHIIHFYNTHFNSFALFHRFQVTFAYKNKVEEVKNQGLEEEEETKKMELLKVGI